MDVGGRASGRPMAWRAGVAVSIAGVVLGVLVSVVAPSRPAPAATVAAVGLSPSTAPVPSGSVRYYVVGPPVNGQPEYLFAIAARTLGNGKRADEIFELNQGRRQFDGSALVGPTVLHPGWILVLPADATGPGVLTGPLPTPAAEVSRPVSTPNRPAQSPAASTDESPPLVHGIGVILVITVMFVAIALLRRQRPLRLRGSRNRSQDRATGVALPAARAAPAHAPQLAAASSAVRPEAPAAWESPRAPSTGATIRPVPAPAGGIGGGRRVAADPPDDLLKAEVTAASGLDRATVRLAGARLPRTTPPWLWLDVDAPGPPAPTYVAVGAVKDRALCLDIVQAPDVLTVTGDEPKARRLSAAIARQLVDRGVAVTVVGQAVGGPVAGAQVAPSLSEAQTATDDPTAVQVIVCGPVQDDASALLRLTARTNPRTVVVLVGGVPPGRWSVEVR